MEPGATSIGTVTLPHRLEPPLFRALLDLRRAVGFLVPEWKAHPEESRFQATKRTYPLLRYRYGHLAAGWSVTAAHATSAVLNTWDRCLRRARRQDPERFARMQRALPRRRMLKASLHPNLFRWDRPSSHLVITLRPGGHVTIDLSRVTHPLSWRYGTASDWHFGLTRRPKALLFHFRIPRSEEPPNGAVGIDLNFDSVDLAATDGVSARVDRRPITRVQKRMARKRQAVQRALAKDLRHQRAVLRRYGGRERRRVTPLLHRAANELIGKAGPRAIVLENLTDATDTILRRDSGRRGPELHRRLSAWAHGRLVEIVSYKARTPIIGVSSEGTSQECPRCGGHLALPSEGRDRSARRARMTRQLTCESCGGAWDRDAAAARAVLARGCRLLRGTTIAPSARSALLEAATWRSSEGDGGGRRPGASLTVGPMKGDDAKSDVPTRGLPDR